MTNLQNKKIYDWCFKNKLTGVLELYEQYNGGYGLFPTKKELMENVWNREQKGYKVVRVEIILKEV